MANSKYFSKLENEDEVTNILYRDYVTPFRKGYIVVGEDNTIMAEPFQKYASIIENFEVHNSDVFVATHPKAGTTWAQEMVWMICTNLDFKGGEDVLQKRFPFFEICAIYDQEEVTKAVGNDNPEFVRDSIGYTERLKSPRFIKTHLPFSLLPKQIQDRERTPKMIYVIRNPKDTCISYYHHVKLLEGYRGNFEDFCTLFLNGKSHYGPFWTNIFGYWTRRDWPNILILRYEDMKKDLPSVIQKTAQFLGKTLTEEQIEILSKHLSLESMRNNKAVNQEYVVKLRKEIKLCTEEDGQFIRSGTVGQYVKDMSPELNQKFDEWIEENIAGTALTFC